MRRPKNKQSKRSPSVSETRKRTVRPFPASSFEDALEFAREIFRFGSGQRVRRLTLFDHLGKSPDSSASRMLITNSNRYGLTQGSYASDYLSVTEDGARAVGDGVPEKEQRRAWIELAILRIPPFAALYERFTDVRLPARAVLIDALKELDVPSDAAEEGVDTFIVNLRFVGLLQTLSGAERIVAVDHLLDGMPATVPGTAAAQGLKEPRSEPASVPQFASEQTDVVASDAAEFDTTCFYIAPIGEEESEQRRHSDLFLANIVEPALATFKLTVVRADRIGKSGMITRQVIEYLLRSRLVIADLSFHNPNVFYELALRHAVRLPIVQLIRAEDRLPFDIHQMRTVVIDNRDIYSLVPKLETYRSEIANQVRRALEAAAEVDTPVSVFFPSFKVSI